jgi:hypothetical protein
METSVETQTLVRLGDRLALILDDGLLGRLGIKADTPLWVSVVEGTLVVTPLNRQGRSAMFEAALRTMSVRYEKTMRRLAE